MEKYAKDLEGFLGSFSLPRSNFFVPLCKDNRSPQLRVFPAWGSPQMAKLASKLTSHSAGCGGGGLSPADGEESDWKGLPKVRTNPSHVSSTLVLALESMLQVLVWVRLSPFSLLLLSSPRENSPPQSPWLATKKAPPVWLLHKSPGLEMSAGQSPLPGLQGWGHWE